MDTAEAAPEAAARHGRSVRGHLAIYTAALIVPILLFTAFLLWQVASAERSRLEGEAGDLAGAIAVAIDRDVTGVIAAMNVLSSSAFLEKGDLENFHRQASGLQGRLGISPVLADLSGQQLVNTRLPWGSALPKTNVPIDAEALARGRPYVTDSFIGQVSRERLSAIVNSVSVAGEPRYVLIFALAVDRFDRILADAGVSSEYTASIVDRAGIIVARSTRASEFVGREATEDLQRATASGRNGSWTGTTIDGTSVFGAYARSRLTDYRAAVGIRYADLNRPLWRSLSVFAGLGTAIAALSVVLGVFFGQRITAPIAALSRQASALGRGEPVVVAPSAVREANEVGAELEAASTSLRERETDLRDANDEIQRFAYIVSHDLRSPLVNIMGFTTELEALRVDVFKRLAELRSAIGAAEGARDVDGELGRDFDEAIGFIKASIGKMDRLINAILRLSREGRRDFHPERVDMNALFGSIRASLAHQAETADATVVAAPLPAVTSDRLALEQIFSNLVDNAVKYLRKGVPGRIEITGRAAPGVLVYDVRDNGRGIDLRDRERVFDLFRRSGVQDRPGEGIGLAHVRALVRRLGGTIALTSEPGRGSTFTVTLPRRWPGERQRKAA